MSENISKKYANPLDTVGRYVTIRLEGINQTVHKDFRKEEPG